MFSPGTAHGFHRGYCHPASPPRDGAERALLRLQQAQDSEALHDLRVCLRRIRSLLRPLRGCPGATRLDRAAAELGRLTTPLRDLEVLIAELARHRLDWQANVRRSDLQARCRQLLTHPQLIDFPSLLHARRALPPHRATHRQIPPEPTPATPATATAPGIGRYRLRSPPSAAVDKTPALRRRSLSATPSLSPKRRCASKRRKTPSATGTIGRSGACRPSIRRISGRCCPYGKLSNAGRWPERIPYSPPYHRRWRRKPAAHHDPEKAAAGHAGPENADEAQIMRYVL